MRRGRDTLSLWNLGATEVVGIDFSPRMLDLARRLTLATGAPATWVEADVLHVPHDLDRTADLLYTGRGAIIWLQDLDAWAAVLRRLLAPSGRLVIFDGHPAEWLFDGDGRGGWILTDYDYFGGPEASQGWAPEYIDRLSIPDGGQHLKFARALDARRDRHGAAAGGPATRARRRAPGRLVARTPRRAARGARVGALIVLRRGDAPDLIPGAGRADLLRGERLASDGVSITIQAAASDPFAPVPNVALRPSITTAALAPRTVATPFQTSIAVPTSIPTAGAVGDAAASRIAWPQFWSGSSLGSTFALATQPKPIATVTPPVSMSPGAVTSTSGEIGSAM